ncbi:MAG: YihY/virulence factor BrkB family protein, partial [Gemmatimonadetes bacterium]|nr:YihY/virulence factor BrkB family protein [Gemmatimonadota bacterium]
LARARAASGDFLRRVFKKAEQDQIFFMGGAIAFNVLVAIVPLALAVVGVAGFFLQAQEGVSPADPVVQYLLQVLPPVSPEFAEYMSETLNEIISQSTGLFTIGTIVFAWLATRLVGTLRAALREIFDIQQDRGIVAGKFFDLQMVFVAGTLLAINIAITVALDLVTDAGIEFLHVAAGQESLLRGLIRQALAFMTIWFMFVLIYRYLPARRIQWRTALICATFTAVLFELMKAGFAFYFQNANYATTYGALGFVAIVVIYVYYMALAFILGGQVGQVASLQRIRRRQKERLG